MRGERPVSEKRVETIQWLWLGVAFGLIGGIIAWIAHLIRTAWRLGDAPSASIGISLVSIPIFLTMLGVIVYVFLGLRRGRGER